MYRGISLKPPQGRIAAELRFNVLRTFNAPAVRFFLHSVTKASPRSRAQSSKAAFNALKLRFKNCKAAVQCPAGFQCSGAAVQKALRAVQGSKHLRCGSKQQGCVQSDEGAVQREWSQVTISRRTSSEMVSSIFPYSVAAPV